MTSFTRIYNANDTLYHVNKTDPFYSLHMNVSLSPTQDGQVRIGSVLPAGAMVNFTSLNGNGQLNQTTRFKLSLFRVSDEKENNILDEVVDDTGLDLVNRGVVKRHTGVSLTEPCYIVLTTTDPLVTSQVVTVKLVALFP